MATTQQGIMQAAVPMPDFSEVMANSNALIKQNRDWQADFYSKKEEDPVERFLGMSNKKKLTTLASAYLTGKAAEDEEDRKSRRARLDEINKLADAANIEQAKSDQEFVDKQNQRTSLIVKSASNPDRVAAALDIASLLYPGATRDVISNAARGIVKEIEGFKTIKEVQDYFRTKYTPEDTKQLGDRIVEKTGGLFKPATLNASASLGLSESASGVIRSETDRAVGVAKVTNNALDKAETLLKDFDINDPRLWREAEEQDFYRALEQDRGFGYQKKLDELKYDADVRLEGVRHRNTLIQNAAKHEQELEQIHTQGGYQIQASTITANAQMTSAGIRAESNETIADKNIADRQARQQRMITSTEKIEKKKSELAELIAQNNEAYNAAKTLNQADANRIKAEIAERKAKIAELRIETDMDIAELNADTKIELEDMKAESRLKYTEKQAELDRVTQQMKSTQDHNQQSGLEKQKFEIEKELRRLDHLNKMTVVEFQAEQKVSLAYVVLAGKKSLEETRGKIEQAKIRLKGQLSAEERLALQNDLQEFEREENDLNRTHQASLKRMSLSSAEEIAKNKQMFLGKEGEEEFKRRLILQNSEQQFEMGKTQYVQQQQAQRAADQQRALLLRTQMDNTSAALIQREKSEDRLELEVQLARYKKELLEIELRSEEGRADKSNATQIRVAEIRDSAYRYATDSQAAIKGQEGKVKEIKERELKTLNAQEKAELQRQKYEQEQILLKMKLEAAEKMNQDRLAVTRETSALSNETRRYGIDLTNKTRAEVAELASSKRIEGIKLQGEIDRALQEEKTAADEASKKLAYERRMLLMDKQQQNALELAEYRGTIQLDIEDNRASNNLNKVYVIGQLKADQIRLTSELRTIETRLSTEQDAAARSQLEREKAAYEQELQKSRQEFERETQGIDIKSAESLLNQRQTFLTEQKDADRKQRERMQDKQLTAKEAEQKFIQSQLNLRASLNNANALEKATLSKKDEQYIVVKRIRKTGEMVIADATENPGIIQNLSEAQRAAEVLRRNDTENEYLTLDSKTFVSLAKNYQQQQNEETKSIASRVSKPIYHSSGTAVRQAVIINGQMYDPETRMPYSSIDWSTSAPKMNDVRASDKVKQETMYDRKGNFITLNIGPTGTATTSDGKPVDVRQLSKDRPPIKLVTIQALGGPTMTAREVGGSLYHLNEKQEATDPVDMGKYQIVATPKLETDISFTNIDMRDFQRRLTQAGITNALPASSAVATLAKQLKSSNPSLTKSEAVEQSMRIVIQKVDTEGLRSILEWANVDVAKTKYSPSVIPTSGPNGEKVQGFKNRTTGVIEYGYIDGNGKAFIFPTR